MKHAHVVANERAEHQQSWGGAFGEGLKRHGWRVTAGSTPAACDLLVMWGVRNQPWIAAQKAAGGEVCILERGYVGDRFVWTSVSFGGGLNGRGVFRGPFQDGRRWERHFAGLMQPWRRIDDGYALIIGQVPGDMSLAGIDAAGWYRKAARVLSARGLAVRFRPHPQCVQRGKVEHVEGVRLAEGDLAEALAGAAMAVTINSNTGVEAALAGCPVTAADSGSMAWDVSGRDVDEVVTPDRTAWAHALAWKQWRRDELVTGECWAAVGAS